MCLFKAILQFSLYWWDFCPHPTGEGHCPPAGKWDTNDSGFSKTFINITSKWVLTPIYIICLPLAPFSNNWSSMGGRWSMQRGGAEGMSWKVMGNGMWYGAVADCRGTGASALILAPVKASCLSSWGFRLPQKVWHLDVNVSLGNSLGRAYFDSGLYAILASLVYPIQDRAVDEGGSLHDFHPPLCTLLPLPILPPVHKQSEATGDHDTKPQE